MFLVSSIPFALLAWGLLRGDLGINPVETLQHTTGDWTLRFLVFTLAITPLRKTLQLPELIRYRRMLGLFAFFYVVLHFITYLGPDQSFNLSGMWDDVAKRKFVTVGFAAFVLLIPLAATSTSGMIRRLGGKRWQALHRLIYVCAILGGYFTERSWQFSCCGDCGTATFAEKGARPRQSKPASPRRSSV